jgi:hypothetical protein
MLFRLRAVVIVLSIFAAAAIARADWTAVASTGTIDEADVKKVVLNTDGSASINSTISSTSAMIRFNVVDSPTIERVVDPDAITGQVRLAMRFRDNGTGARVIATMKRVLLGGFGAFASSTPANAVVAKIDSDQVPPSNDWQTASIKAADCCTGDRGLNFLDFGYIVEVQLIKNHDTGTPGVMGVQLFRDEP